jgi:hypothetical protein
MEVWSQPEQIVVRTNPTPQKKRAGWVAQGSEFKPQYHKKKKEKDNWKNWEDGAF